MLEIDRRSRPDAVVEDGLKVHIFFLLTLVWGLLVFGGWDLLQFMAGLHPGAHLSSDSFATFSNHIAWLPLSAEVARGNLFPIEASLGTGESGAFFYPYISLWIHGAMIALLGLDVAQVVGRSLFPVVVLALLIMIYRHYLSWRWSIALSILGLVAFTPWPFRDFVAGILSGVGWLELSVPLRPDAMGFPFPALPLVAFLGTFLLSIRRVHLSRRRVIILSIMWALQIEFHPLNAIFGLPFWFSLLALRLWRAEGDRVTIALVRRLAANMALSALFLSPFAFRSFSIVTGNTDWTALLVIAPPENAFADSGVIVLGYFVLPVTLLGLAYLTIRIDPYELLFKFLPVWLAMSVELVLIFLWEAFGIGVSPQLTMSRLAMFFLHMFYFVPVLYCFSRVGGPYSAGPESMGISGRARSAWAWLVRDASLVYLPALVLLLTAYAASSANNAYGHHQRIQSPAIANVSAEIRVLTAGSQAGWTLVSSTGATNFRIPLEGRYGTLWVNRFVNNVGEDEAIERLALYAHLVGWERDVFLKFMLPAPEPIDSPGALINLTSDEMVPGLGYWLVYQRRPLGPAEEQWLRIRLADTFEIIPLAKKLKAFNVRRLLLASPPSPAIAGLGNMKKTEVGTLVEFD